MRAYFTYVKLGFSYDCLSIHLRVLSSLNIYDHFEPFSNWPFTSQVCECADLAQRRRPFCWAVAGHRRPKLRHFETEMRSRCVSLHFTKVRWLQLPGNRHVCVFLLMFSKDENGKPSNNSWKIWTAPLSSSETWEDRFAFFFLQRGCDGGDWIKNVSLCCVPAVTVIYIYRPVNCNIPWEKRIVLLSFVTGPAQVPMMSPNGSVPPIYVPPGYISQVGILCCSIRSAPRQGARLLWRLQAVRLCSPVDHRGEWSAAGSGFTSAARVSPRWSLSSPPPSASTTCPPACLHPTPCHDGTATPPLHRHGRRCGRHEFSVHLSVSPGTYLLRAGWAGAFSLTCLASRRLWKPSNVLGVVVVPVVSAESHPQHGRPLFVHRDDRTNKAYERLQKKLKDRQGGGVGGQVKDSPPSSPQKSCCCPSTADVHNGVGVKGLEAEPGNLSHAAIGSAKQTGRGRNGELGGKRCLQLDCRPAFHTFVFVYVIRIVPNLDKSPFYLYRDV